MNTDANNIAVVYSMGGYEQVGALDADTIVYLAPFVTLAPLAWEVFTGRGGETVSASALVWGEGGAEGLANHHGSKGAYVRHNNRAIPVRLVGGAS